MGVFTGEIVKIDNSSSKNITYYMRRLGVSVLFSGAAVGVSHVVQATRAGADFSFALLPVIGLCLLIKYPSFLAGAKYTAVAKETVVAGYSRIGRWTLPIIALSFMGVMFSVVAAVALLAASLLLQITGLPMSPLYAAIGLIAMTTITVLYLPFERFQNAMRYVFVTLVFLSVLALGLALPSVEFSAVSFSFDWTAIQPEQIFFIAALIGWMPAGMDLPMMHSQWLMATGKPPANAVEDFNFGYLATSFLAILFLAIGAIFFFSSSISLPASASGFSAQLLTVYQNTLGPTAGYIMGGVLFFAIFSTLIVCVDGFPRVLAEVLGRMRKDHGQPNTWRASTTWLQAGGAIVIVLFVASSLYALVDFATVLSFVLCPLFAGLNHRLLSLEKFTRHEHVSRRLRLWSLFSVIFFTAFAVYYLGLRLFA